MSASRRIPPFVGREAELAALLRHVERAARGEGGVVLVAGEPGVGKTRLLVEAATRARALGWRVLVGRAYESAGMLPYLPFLEALVDHDRAEPIDLSKAAPELGLLVPEWSRRLQTRSSGRVLSL